MPRTVQDLTERKQRALHRLRLLETGEMSVRCLRTARLDNSAAILIARSQIASIDDALARHGRTAS